MIVLRYILGFLFLGGCWHAGALALGPDLLPDPVATIRLFAESLSTPEFWGHILVSLWRLTLGLVAAVAVAFPLGLLLGHCRAADLAGSPLLFITYPLPKIVLLPVFFTLVGLGDASRVLLIALTTGYQVLVIIRAGALSIDPSWVKAFRSMGGTTAEASDISMFLQRSPRSSPPSRWRAARRSRCSFWPKASQPPRGSATSSWTPGAWGTCSSCSTPFWA